jgi:hypothetical protein
MPFGNSASKRSSGIGIDQANAQSERRARCANRISRPDDIVHEVNRQGAPAVTGTAEMVLGGLKPMKTSQAQAG